MTISDFKFEDKSLDWRLEHLALSKLTLLVGASGVGKTQILRALMALKQIAGGASINGITWKIEFNTLDGQKYIWEGEFENKGVAIFSNIEDEDDDDFQERLAKAQQQCDEYNRIFDAYYNRIQLQKKLVELDAKISELPEPEPENLFTSDFDYRVEIQNYPVAEINTSVWQYSLSAQQWINNLLTQIDSWENNHQHLLANALALNTTLTKKLPISLNLNATEQEILNTRHTDLQQRLNFSLEPLRSTLIDLLQQNQQILKLRLKDQSIQY